MRARTGYDYYSLEELTGGDYLLQQGSRRQRDISSALRI